MTGILLLASLMALANANHFFGPRPCDPNVRMDQLLKGSEGSGTAIRHWYPDTPSHLTPVRVHGGIGI